MVRNRQLSTIALGLVIAAGTAVAAMDAGSLWADAESWGGLAERRAATAPECLRLGRMHQERGQWLLAEDAYSASKRLCPPITAQTIDIHRTATYQLGVSQVMSGKPTAAAKTLDAVETRYSGYSSGVDTGRLRFIIGLSYFLLASNAAETATDSWFEPHAVRRIFRLSGDGLGMPDAAFSGVRGMFAETISESKAYDLALDAFKTISQVDPDSIYADNALLVSGLLLRRARNYKDALERYERLINNYASSPAIPFACLEAAEALLQIKQRPIYNYGWDMSAERYFRRAQAGLSGVIGPVADRMKRIESLLQTRQVNRAIARARFYIANKEYRAAEIVLDEARRLNPDAAATRQAEQMLRDNRRR